jgi:hypothetical protein
LNSSSESFDDFVVVIGIDFVVVIMIFDFFFALLFVLDIINVFLDFVLLPTASSPGDSDVLARHDNWTRYVRPSTREATAHSRLGLPS